MTDPASLPPPGAPLEITYEPRRPRGPYYGAWFAWVVIVLVSVGLPLMHLMRPRASMTVGVEAPPAAIDAQTTMMGKYLVGAARMQPASSGDLLKQFPSKGGSPANRIAHVVLRGELEGRGAAQSSLRLSGGAEEEGDFFNLYANGRPLPADVRERYGFFARLAEVQGKPDTDPIRAAVLREANKTLYFMLGFGTLLVGALGLGACLLVTAIILLALGILRFKMTSPNGPANVYVEAFALYLGGFVVLSLLVQIVMPDANLLLRAMPLVICVIAAMVWPLLRGVSWGVLCDDWGINAGTHVLLEVACGIGGYLAGLPILAGGIAVTYLLMQLTSAQPSHPIVEMIGQNPLPLFLLAVVFAPITEEILFRGALLAHLRGGLGAVVSAIIAGLIFAAVHPQGWAAIPALGSIGFVFAMIRQWRGSLVGPIAAHALNNGTVLTLVLLLAT